MAFQEMVDSDAKDPTEEVKKHRSSDMSMGNSLILKTESGLTDNIEHFLPNFQITLPFSYPTTEIFDIFSSSSLKKNFQVIEKNSTMATAVYKERYSFKSILLCCLPPEQRRKNIISAVRLHIIVNEAQCKRVVHVKGIYGFPQVIIPLISEFQCKIEASLNLSLKKDSRYESIVEDEETAITCKHESSSYYQFHKILSSESYTLGKSIALFVNAFAEQYRNPEESVNMLPLPLDSIKETVEQAVEALFTHYNYGRANTERMMMYCRPAVEKYVYSKVYAVLFPIYICKTLKVQEVISEKKGSLENLERGEVCRVLGIREELVACDNFSEAGEIADRIEEMKSPIEKVNCTSNLVALIKALIIDFNQGTAEDGNDHEEVMILVYILLKSNLKYIAAEMEMIKDYLGSRQDVENKAISNVYDALQYILSEINL